MGAATAQSFDTAQQQLAVIASPAAAESVLAVARSLQDVPQLAATLSDDLIESSVKVALVDRVFAHSIDAAAVTYLERLAVLPWSSPREFVGSVETLGVLALSGTEPTTTAGGLLDAADLFEHNWDLTKAVGDLLADDSARLVLVKRVFGESLGAAALQVVQHVALTRSAGQLAPALRRFATLILAADGKQLAIVRSAISLSDTELKQLLAPLERTYGTVLVAHTQLEPDLVGGAKVSVGSTVYDGSIQSRLRDLRNALAA